MEDILAFASQLAIDTGELLKEYFSQTGMHTEFKSDHTVVTRADFAADEKIRAAIQAAFPQDQLLTEESVTSLPSTGEHTWVVDPLDGTTNFSLGLPIWGVSIARLENGYPQLGVLYFPILDELYAAERGKGTAMNGETLKIIPKDKYPPYTFFTCCSRTHKRYNVSIRYKTRILGAAAYDFCAVARGAAIIGFQSKTKIWDIASGWLILEEAGGIVEVHTGPDPFPLQAGQDYNEINYPTIMAADQRLAQEARQGIKLKT